MYFRLGLHVQIRLYYVLPYKAKSSAQHGIGFILDPFIVCLGLTMPNLQKKRLLIFEIFNIKKCTLIFGTEYIFCIDHYVPGTIVFNMMYLAPVQDRHFVVCLLNFETVDTLIDVIHPGGALDPLLLELGLCLSCFLLFFPYKNSYNNFIQEGRRFS